MPLRLPGQGPYDALPGSVLLSTDSYAGFVDQVHAGVSCSPGTSVYRGGCDLAGATPVSLLNLDPDVAPLQFRMSGSDASSGVPLLFVSGFEIPRAPR